MNTALRLTIPLVALVLSHAGPASAQRGAPTGFHERFVRLAGQRGLADSVRLHRLFDLDWEDRMVESPESATYFGYPGQDDRWTDLSVPTLQRLRRELPDRALVLRTIRRDQLGAVDRLSFDVFTRDVADAAEGARFPAELIQVTQRDGPQYLSDVLASMPATTTADYERIVLRLSRIPAVIDATIVLLDSGVARGITPPRITLRDVPAQIDRLTPDDAMQSALLLSFAKFPASMPAAEQSRLRDAAARAYASGVRASYRRLRDYLATTYIPHARESLARRALPDGAAWYAYDVRHQTTLSRTPAEIHRIGLSEVARIRVAMDSVIRSTGFTGTFAAFTSMLRTDPRFFYTDSASLVRAYRDIAKRIDPGLASLFGRLPRLPYGVATIPAYAAPSQTTAYYQGGAVDAHRAGQFYVNTYKLDARPIWEMEALTAHEAVPGHHLQIALGQEIDGVPAFRRHAQYTGFVEGWALYAESLGAALGLYQDPYSRFGQLTYEMWRAIRLVLDTGIHEQGWTREQAIAYFTANSAKTEQDIVSEVDRYIVWPGQALAYKSGELAIRALRSRAERELGASFDVRAFHDQLLGAGALPLDVLEARTLEWIQARKR